MKLARPIWSLILCTLLFVGYWCIENKLLPWVYSSTYVGVTAAIMYVAATTAYFLSGKRAFKMVEWPTITILGALLLAIITKIAK